MSTATINEEIIEDNEPITRVLFAPSMVDNGVVSPTAFELVDLERGPEKYVSLFLLNVFEPTRENCIDLHARVDGDELYGHAISVVSKCTNISYDGITIIFKRHDRNTPGHIGLHYSKEHKFFKGKCSDPSYLIVTALIARQFQAIKFPA